MKHGINTDEKERGFVELAPPNFDRPQDPAEYIFVPLRNPCSFRMVTVRRTHPWLKFPPIEFVRS